MVEEIPDARRDGVTIDLDDPVINALVRALIERAQYLDEKGLEYLIARLKTIYVQQLPGYGLSKNDFTDALKQKLEQAASTGDITNLQDQINSLVSAGGGLKYKVVDALPDPGEDSVIYLYKKDEVDPDPGPVLPPEPPPKPGRVATTANIYKEYLWVGDKYELLGAVDVGDVLTNVGIRLNDVQYFPNVEDNNMISLPNVVRKTKINGQTVNPDRYGTLDVGQMVRVIRLNNTEFIPNQYGGIDLGTIEGGTSGDFLPLTGGTLTGNLRLKNSTNYGTVINFGDGDYVHISEPTDDKLEIKGNGGINLVTNGTVMINGNPISTGATIHSGSTYPVAGTGDNGDLYFRIGASY